MDVEQHHLGLLGEDLETIGQVERQLRLAARLIGACWYSAWVDAGQPDLSRLPKLAPLMPAQRLALEAEEAAALAPGRGVGPGHEE